ncbi:MAG: energy transducer TonB [Candidatus Omnitrophica bacterium]|nr:energy transducer TonB [Candidatus Omnitrophota bacterium]
MNNFFLPSLLVSLMLHTGIFLIPEKPEKNIKDQVDVNDNNSIEVSLVRLLPDIEITNNEIDKKGSAAEKNDIIKGDLQMKVVSSGIDEVKTKKEKNGNEKKREEEKKEMIHENVLNIEKINIPVLKDKFILKQIDALLVKNKPDYPELARIQGWQGKVIILAVTDNKGNVDDAQIYESSGFNMLDTEAVKAVRKWKFAGINNKIQVKIPIEFVLYE